MGYQKQIKTIEKYIDSYCVVLEQMDYGWFQKSKTIKIQLMLIRHLKMKINLKQGNIDYLSKILTNSENEKKSKICQNINKYKKWCQNNHFFEYNV